MVNFVLLSPYVNNVCDEIVKVGYTQRTLCQ